MGHKTKEYKNKKNLKRRAGREERTAQTSSTSVLSLMLIIYVVCAFFMINIYLFTALQFASQSSFQRLHGQEKPSQTFKCLSAENVLSLLETAHYCYLLQQRNEILMQNNPGMDSFLLTQWKSK